MDAPKSRNAPCPCGSGRRYKACHGGLADTAFAAAASTGPRELIARALEAMTRNDVSAAEGMAKAVHAIDPQHPDAWHILALGMLLRDDHAGALDACDRAIAVLPEHAPFHASRARALIGLQRHAEAAPSARRALELTPDDASALTLLGRALDGDESADNAAEDAWRNALHLDPGNVEALFYLGNAERTRGDDAEAIRIYEQALSRRADDALLLNNLGLALERTGAIDEARQRYEQALDAREPPPEAHANLARLLQGRQDYGGSAAHYHAYVTIKSDASADVWSNLGFCQHKIGAFEMAEQSYRKALELAPDDANTRYLLGALLTEAGRSEDAIPVLEALDRVHPTGQVQQALMFARQLVCNWTDWEATLEQLRERARNLADTPGDQLIPFQALALPMSADEQFEIARRYADSYSAAAANASVGMPASAYVPAKPGQRLKIGYVSPDLRLHPIAYLLTELWERHDRDRFEVYAYSIGPGEDSPLRRRIEHAFEHFVDAGFESIEATAARIRADGIQILIDLNGFTFRGRPEIFALRPAPVQMHWLGYLGTLGADWCDYVITDRYATPPEMQPHFTERFLYLAGGYTPSDTRRAIEPGPHSRSAQGLPDDAIVFCCFNNAYKIVPPVFDAWMRILAAVPRSVLWLSPSSDATLANLRREAVARGIDADRLVFAPRAELSAYLARLRLADLFLDTWPYNAGTTANDALYVGLPILTCAGETMASRVAASQLLTIGMPELVTRDLGAYEAVAIALGRSPDKLAALRHKLETRRTASTLFDMARYTRGFEDALIAAWRDYERATTS